MIAVALVDPPAFTPPYDDALASALARAGARVTLFTSRFAYGDPPAPDGYARRELFYGHATGAPGSGLRRLTKLLEHVPDMVRLRRATATADVVHFQWLGLPWLDPVLLPRGPIVLTAHDLLPREPRPGQVGAQRRALERVDAVVAHSEYGRAQLVDRLGVPAAKVQVIHHGAFVPGPDAGDDLPAELRGEPDSASEPVVLFFGLLRPYKGIDTLLRAWREVSGARLWIAGRPMMDLAPLRALSGQSVRWVPRFVTDAERTAMFTRASVVVLPYARTERFDQSGVLATALGHGRAIVASDIGGFSEIAATGAVRLVPPGDADALAAALSELLSDPAARERLGQAASAAARGPFSWERAAHDTLALYERLLRR